MKMFSDLAVGDRVFIINHDEVNCKYIFSVRTIKDISVSDSGSCIELTYDRPIYEDIWGQFVLGSAVYKSHMQTDRNSWLFTDEEEAFTYRHELRRKRIEQIKKDIKDLKYKQTLYEEIF